LISLPLRTSVPLDDSPEAAYSSRVLNAVSDAIHQQLRSHPINLQREAQHQPPANLVLLRGPGERINVESFQKVHGLRPFMIAPTCIIAGLGMSLGIELLTAPGATGDYHTNLLSKAETALAALADETKQFEFGFVHVKAVDDAGHDKDVDKKIHFIEKADEMIARLIAGASEELAGIDVSIVVTGDHTTPVLYGDHSFEPVPFAIARVRSAADALRTSAPAIPVAVPSPLMDAVESFSEISAARGVLGRFGGDQVMEIVKQFRTFSP
jgi:2,3-diphosphopglycerate-independent phosphoglycerate mutase